MQNGNQQMPMQQNPPAPPMQQNPPLRQQGSGSTGASAPPNMQQVLGSLPPDVRQRIAAMPPDQQMEALRKLAQDYAGQRGVANDQMAMADQLRAGAGAAEGRQAGRVYVAANPLEHLGKAYQQRKATDMQQQAIDDKKRLAEEYGGANQFVMSQMLR